MDFLINQSAYKVFVQKTNTGIPDGPHSVIQRLKVWYMNRHTRTAELNYLLWSDDTVTQYV